MRDICNIPFRSKNNRERVFVFVEARAPSEKINVRASSPLSFSLVQQQQQQRLHRIERLKSSIIFRFYSTQVNIEEATRPSKRLPIVFHAKQSSAFVTYSRAALSIRLLK